MIIKRTRRCKRNKITQDSSSIVAEEQLILSVVSTWPRSGVQLRSCELNCAMTENICGWFRLKNSLVQKPEKI